MNWYKIAINWQAIGNGLGNFFRLIIQGMMNAQDAFAALGEPSHAEVKAKIQNAINKDLYEFDITIRQQVEKYLWWAKAHSSLGVKSPEQMQTAISQAGLQPTPELLKALMILQSKYSR